MQSGFGALEEEEFPLRQFAPGRPDGRDQEELARFADCVRTRIEARICRNIFVFRETVRIGNTVVCQ